MESPGAHRGGRGSAAFLRSPLDPRGLPRLEEAVEAHTAPLDAAEREALAEPLWADVFSEYDARLLAAHLGRLGLPFTEAFRSCVHHWAADEELHHRGFLHAYAALTGRPTRALEAELEGRGATVDFGPLEPLFEDELSITCLFAYDELATVDAYLAGRAAHARLGPELERFARVVTADEGRHFRNFLKLVRQEHGERLDEVPGIVARIRGLEGTRYAATFVLDHDDDVWSEGLFDRAAGRLCRHLAV